MSNIIFNFEKSGISEAVIDEHKKSLDPYREHMTDVVEQKDYSSLEASLVVVVGIGGSNLGTKAIYDALVGLNDGYRKRIPNIIFVDTVGEKLFEILQDICKESIHGVDEFLINAISKSGGTAETVFNLEAIYDMFSKKLGETVKERIVVTTNENSALWSKASMVSSTNGGKYWQRI